MSTTRHDIVDIELCKASPRSWSEADYTVFGRAEYWYRVRNAAPAHVNVQLHQLVRRAHREYEGFGRPSPWRPGDYVRVVDAETVACPWHPERQAAPPPPAAPVADFTAEVEAALEAAKATHATPEAPAATGRAPLTCSVCGKPRGKGAARGLCRTHYEAARRKEKKS